jgi:hypothetical protein
MNAFRRSLFVILVAVAAVIAGTELRKLVDGASAPTSVPTMTPAVSPSPGSSP